MGLQTGDRIPIFTLNDQQGKPFEVAQYLGVHHLVIFFYPKDYTPGCTREVCSFRDSFEAFTDSGAMVIGISADSHKTHRKFASTYKLPFVLLSDPNNQVRKLFKVKNNFFNLLPGRETYVVNKAGKIVMVFNSVRATHHIKMALNALKNQ